MDALLAGYNLVERALVGHRYEDASEVMSIVAFLRRLQRGESLPRRIKVVGFDRLLATLESPAVLRPILQEAAEGLLRRSPVVLLPVEKLTQDREPKLLWRGQEIRIFLLFGNRLEIQGAGYFHSPFNIP